MNTGNSSAAESPFGGIKESGYGKESGKDVAIQEYMVSRVVWCLIRVKADFVPSDHQDWYFDSERPLLDSISGIYASFVMNCDEDVIQWSCSWSARGGPGVCPKVVRRLPSPANTGSWGDRRPIQHHAMSNLSPALAKFILLTGYHRVGDSRP